MNVYARDIGMSLTVCTLGAILFSVCCSLDYYNYYYYYVDTTMYTVVHVLFWMGLVIFLVGLLNLVRVLLARRPEFRGLTLSTTPRPVPPTPVTVMSTGVVYQSELNQPGILPHGQQYQQAWPGQSAQFGTQARIFPWRPQFRGLTLSTTPQPVPPTPVTVMSTGVVYQSELTQPRSLPPGQQYQQAWPGQPAQPMPPQPMPPQSMPPMPPSYDQIITK